jgi:hypothetical protein
MGRSALLELSEPRLNVGLKIPCATEQAGIRSLFPFSREHQTPAWCWKAMCGANRGAELARYHPTAALQRGANTQRLAE